MAIVVHVDLAGIRQFAAAVAKLGDGRVAQVAREGLQEGGDKVRTQVRRALKVQTNVKRYGVIVANVPGRLAGPLQYIISASGKGLPIQEFPYSVPGPVEASPWAVSRTFKRSFRQRYKGGLRARLSSKRFPIRSLYGPSLPKELIKDQSAAAFFKGSSEVLQAIEKRVARIMP